MILSFKYVGQGDSILLEWHNSGKIILGIIDCNKQPKGNNPVLSYVKSLVGDIVVEFIVLSHPHEDHFSGLKELLDYFDKSGITVNHFLHTCASVKNYLRGIDSLYDKTLLNKIFNKASEMYDLGKVKIYGPVNDITKEIELIEGIKLKFLYPTSRYYSLYNSKAHKNDTTLNNNPNANYLSTVIKIYTDKWFLLLTSDCVAEVYEELLKSKDSFSGNFSIGQVSHHGSKHNFTANFWKVFKNLYNGNAAVISSGVNDYGHPDPKVIGALEKIGYLVLKTFAIIASTSKMSNDLDLFSELVDSDETTSVGTDIRFEINADSVELLA